MLPQPQDLVAGRPSPMGPQAPADQVISHNSIANSKYVRLLEAPRGCADAPKVGSMQSVRTCILRKPRRLHVPSATLVLSPAPQIALNGG